MPVPMRAARALSSPISAVIPLESTSSICWGMLADAAVRVRFWGRVACRVALDLCALGAFRRAVVPVDEAVVRVGRVAAYERFAEAGRLVADVLRAEVCRVPVAARLRGVGRCIPDGEDPLPGMAAPFPRIGVARTICSILLESRRGAHVFGRDMPRACGWRMWQRGIILSVVLERRAGGLLAGA